MAGSAGFLQDLAVVTAVAALASLVFQRLRFPLVFGLLAAGVVIGPHTPPFGFVQDEETLQILADLGVVLLLFGLGLEFNLRGLRRLGGVAAIVTLVEVLFMFWLGYEAAQLLGWSRLDGVFLGAMLSISSTAIIVSVLREAGRMGEESSRVVFAVLVLEDIAAIVMLVLIGGYAATGRLPLEDAAAVVGRMLVFLLGILFVGLLLVPRLVDAVAARYRPEVVVLTVTGLALAGAALSHVAGFHAGLGAFVMGAIMAEAKRRAEVHQRLAPLHDFFAAIFFVSIGTLVDFQVLAAHWTTVLLLVVLIVVGKFAIGALGTLLVGHSGRTAVGVGTALSQIGEFSFVIAAVGLASGAMSGFLFPVIVGTAALTAFVSPFLIRHADPIGRTLGRAVPAPVRTYVSVYGTWMQGLRRRPGADGALVHARHGAVVAGLVVAVVLGAAFVLEAVGPRLLQEQGLDGRAALLLYWGVVLAVLAPAVLEMVRRLREWTEQAYHERPQPQRLGLRAVVNATLYLMAALLVGLPLAIAAGPVRGQPAVLLAWAAVIAVVLILLGSRIRRLHQQIQRNVEALLEEERVEVPAAEVLAHFAQDFPLELRSEVVTLEDAHWCIGRRLTDLALRSTTGATILVIERGREERVLPIGDTVLLPRDRLTLIGSPEQIEAARAVLERRRPPGAPLQLQPGRVPVGAAWAGQRLQDAALARRFGIQVVAIRRGDTTIANPSLGEEFRAGDVLIVLGPPAQIAQAAQQAAAEAPPPPPAPAASPAA